MIYILIEQAMNGTVTMNTMVTGIEAKSFDEACEKLTHFQHWAEAVITEKTRKKIRYHMANSPCRGWMDDNPLKIV